ncbi:MAG: hypothetical protein ACPGUD_01330 [Parashewanella sp.]
MATVPATQSLSYQGIERCYYASVYDNCWEATHDHLQLGAAVYSARVVNVNGEGDKQYSTSLKRSASLALRYQPSATALDNVHSQLRNETRITEKYARVLNSRSVQANAAVLAAYHKVKSGSQRENIKSLISSSGSSIVDCSNPTKRQLLDCYIQSIRFRGKETTHSAFYVNGARLQITQSQNDKCEVIMVSTANLDRIAQVNICQKLTEILNDSDESAAIIYANMLWQRQFAEIKECDPNTPSATVQAEPHPLSEEELLCHLFARPGVMIIHEVGGGLIFALNNGLLSNLSQARQRSGAYLSRFNQPLTINYYNPVTKNIEEVKSTPQQFNDKIQSISDSQPQLALNMINAICPQLAELSPYKFELLDLVNDIEKRLVVAIRKSVNSLSSTKYSKLITSSHYSKQLQKEDECILTGKKLSELNDLIEVYTGREDIPWALISKNAVLEMLKSDHPLNSPWNQNKLTVDSFRQVPLYLHQ